MASEKKLINYSGWEYVPGWFFIFIFIALSYETFHWIEHVAQIYQHWWLQVPIAESHGILFFFDLEWIHFLFNLFILSAFVLLIVFRQNFSLHSKTRAFVTASLIVGFAVQAYHFFEHIIRMVQHARVDCSPCPGFLGWYMDIVYLHFAFNTVAALILWFVALEYQIFQKALWRWFKK